MSKTVDFKFTKDWGSIKKDSHKTLNIALARSLQDVRKVGKIVKPGAAKAEKPKVVKPEADKVEPKAKARATK